MVPWTPYLRHGAQITSGEYKLLCNHYQPWALGRDYLTEVIFYVIWLLRPLVKILMRTRPSIDLYLSLTNYAVLSWKFEGNVRVMYHRIGHAISCSWRTLQVESLKVISHCLYTASAIRLATFWWLSGHKVLDSLVLCTRVLKVIILMSRLVGRWTSRVPIHAIESLNMCHGVERPTWC